MHTNESGNTTNRVHLNAHIGICFQTLYSGLCMPITTYSKCPHVLYVYGVHATSLELFSMYVYTAYIRGHIT